MKSMIITALVTATVLSAADKYEMVIHQNSGKIRYVTSSVDSITFEKIGGSVLPLEMVTIPGGTYLYQGTTSTNVASFQMCKYEITQKEYLATMKVNPSNFTGDENRPVEMVTWFDAVLYCNARSKAEGKDTVYNYTSMTGTYGYGVSNLEGLVIDSTKNGYYLPTDQQWEYACRANTISTYYWGNASEYAIVDQYAWYSTNSKYTTNPVGKKLPNAFGLYDMAGNVWEWSESWHPSYVGSYRVFRGGGWNDNASGLTSASRDYYDPSIGSSFFGFRIVLGLR